MKSLLFSLCAICVLSNAFFGQSKKDQIEFLTYKNDSLNSLLIKKINRIETLEETVKFLIDRKRDDSLNCIIQMNQSINQIDNLKEKLRKQSDSLNILREQIKSLTHVRNFSDGIFTDKEYQFILNYFEEKLLWTFSFYSRIEKNISNYENKGYYTARLVGESEEEEAPYISFSDYNPELAGDLDNDGIYEILFSIDFNTGGLTQFNELYCLKVFPNNVFECFPLIDQYKYEKEDPDKPGLKCRRDLENSSLKIEKDKILITWSCWQDNEQHEIGTEYYRFKSTKLLIVNPFDE